MWSGQSNRLIVCLISVLMLVAGCTGDAELQHKPQLLVYCGITMVKPMSEIARIIEQEQGVEITLTQGGSEDLYQSLKASRKGDLYLPGSPAYLQRHMHDGVLGESVPVGYNQAALMVHQGNPKHIRGDVSELLRKDLSVVICNPESGSIGRETRRILRAAGIYDEVVDRAVYLSTDSRNLNGALKRGDADVIVNWRATAFFEENLADMDVVELDHQLAEPKKLMLTLLGFSDHPLVARRFMEYAASAEGQAIFRKYGFLDNASGFD